MNTFKGKIDRVLQSGSEYIVSFVTTDKYAAEALKTISPDVFQTVEVKKYFEKRSLNANAYFHVLCQKMAEHMGLGNEEVKKKLVLEYGAIAENEGGERVMICLPKGISPAQFYPYYKWIDENKTKTGDWYLLYKQTHTLNKKEMARLIDGAITVAEECGIQTKTPDEIARMKSLWAAEIAEN